MTYDQRYNEHVEDRNTGKNHEKATIFDDKLINYTLNPLHPRGGSKAEAMAKALGYDQSNYLALKANIIESLQKYEAVPKLEDIHGQRYQVVMRLTGPNGKEANVLTARIAETGREGPRFINAYVTKKKVKG